MKTIIKIGITLLVILAAFMLIGCTGNSTNNSENTAQETVKSTPAETQASTPEPTPAKTQEPVTIASWSGSSTKNTETFHVPSKEWTISWDTKPGKSGDGNFIVYVYDANNPKVVSQVAANVIGASDESTIMRGEGDYYLAITTTQPYDITVSTL